MASRRMMMGFSKLTYVNEALEIIKKNLVLSIDTVDVDLQDSLNMVTAEDIYAPYDLPMFNRSAVDGYAVVAEDTFGASPTNPITLRVIGGIETGSCICDLPSINSGECCEISTGAPIPRGSNAVVMVEYTKRSNEFIEVYSSVTPWQNVSRRGEDYLKGALVLKRNTRVKVWHIGALASLNIKTVKVYRKLKVAIVSTGDELKDLGMEINPGEVINSTYPMLSAALKEKHCEVIWLGNVPDDIKDIKDKIKKALSTADMVIVTGGTSLGKRDLVPEAINEIANPGIMFHGVAIKPGKPTGIGFDRGKPIFMVSGYPVAAFIAFLVFIEPTINMIYNCPPDPKPIIRAKLSRKLAVSVGFKSFVRVLVKEINGEYIAEPLRLTGSGIISTLTNANGLLIIPEDIEGYDEGDYVHVMLTQPIIKGD